MPRQPIKALALSIPVYKRLYSRRHPHQSMVGVVEELLDMAEKIERQAAEEHKDPLAAIKASVLNHEMEE